MIEVNPYEPPNPRPEDDPPLVAQLAVEGEGMTVEFEQNFEDLVSFNDYHWRQQPKLRLHLYGVIGVLLTVFGVWSLRQAMDDGTIGMRELVFLIGLYLVAFWIYSVVARRTLVRNNLKRHYADGKNLSVVGLRRITITPEYVMSAGPLAQSVHRWAGVEKVRADQEGIYIFVSSLTAFILPRRAFHSEQHFRDFLTTAERYLAG